MLVGFTEQDYQTWSQSLHAYQHQKRTKKPFGPTPPHPSHPNTTQIRSSQSEFNPVLQTYTKQQQQQQLQKREEKDRGRELKNYYRILGKNAGREFDIVTLWGVGDGKEEKEGKDGKIRSPIRSIYNPINNQPLPQFYFQNRQLLLPPQKNFKNIKPSPRDFNIVTGNYLQNHQQKHQAEQQKNSTKIHQKYKSTQSSYNPVIGRYYEQQKQIEYEKKLMESQVEQGLGEKYGRRFPPSYLKREPVVLDRTKPLSRSLMELDRRNQMAKQRFKLKYMIQQEYQQRNIQAEEKRQQMSKNRVYNSQMMGQRGKEIELMEILSRNMNMRKGQQKNANSRNQASMHQNPEYQIYLQNQSQTQTARAHQNQSQKNPSSRGSEQQLRQRSNIKSVGFS